jgi:UDP:flavonoid glycosyltransferase YjiC (YdhE family)
MTPIGSAGDVYPQIAVGRAMARRGHEVYAITFDVFQRTIELSGMRFVPVKHRGTRRGTPDLDLWRPVRGHKMALRFTTAHMRQSFELLDTLHAPGRTVVVGHPLSFGTRVFEEARGVPGATFHVTPASLRAAATPPRFLSPRIPETMNPARARALWWVLDRLVFDRTAAPALNRWRRELGLRPVSGVFNGWITSPQTAVGLFPSWFASEPDWPAHLELTGFPLFDKSDYAEVPPEVEAFLDAGDPPILFTAGSPNRVAQDFFQTAVDVARRLNRRALFISLYPGNIPKQLPPSVCSAAFVPLSRILHRTAGIVHHSGIGTAAHALAAGIPQLLMPTSFDQPENAVRLRRLGVGTIVPPPSFKVDEVAARLDALLRDRSVAESCRRVAALMEDQPATVERACDLLERAGRAS